MFKLFRSKKRPIKEIIEGYNYKEEEKTLVQVLTQLKEEGFTAEFMMTDEGMKAMGSDKTYQPNQVVILDFFRFEGISNPDDMAILYALECEDGTLGTLSNSYGTYADERIDNFLKQAEDTGKNLDDRPH